MTDPKDAKDPKDPKDPGKPSPSDLKDDPLLTAASDAGWDDVPPAPSGPVESPSSPRPIDPPPQRAAGPSFPAYVPPSPIPSSPTTSPSSPTESPSTTTSTPSISTVPEAIPATNIVADGPLLPATFHENDLRAAVGATPLSETSDKRLAPRASTHEDDDDDPRSVRSRRTITVAALALVGGLAIAAVAILGRINSDRYLLACEAERAVPQQGRSFPPWGMRALDGDAWRPLKIAPETRCQPRETDDLRELERLYLAMVLDQATALLTAREVTRLDEAEALLKQALLLTRPPERETDKLAAERNEKRHDIERLLGDVTYWRASAKLRDAATALGEAAKQFDSAAEQHPRHMTDAAAWANHVRKLTQQLTGGPAGLAGATGTTGATSPAAPASAALPQSPASTDHPGAPPGTALPIEPTVTPEAPLAPDAGVSSGGVLL